MGYCSRLDQVRQSSRNCYTLHPHLRRAVVGMVKGGRIDHRMDCRQDNCCAGSDGHGPPGNDGLEALDGERDQFSSPLPGNCAYRRLCTPQF